MFFQKEIPINENNNSIKIKIWLKKNINDFIKTDQLIIK